MLKPLTIANYYNFLNYNYEEYLNEFSLINESYDNIDEYNNGYFKYHFIHPYKRCDERTYNHYQKGLYEALKTHDPALFADKLLDTFESISMIDIDYVDNILPIVDVLYVYLYDESELSKIKQYCILYGYYITSITKEGSKILLIVETKYGYTEKTDEVYNTYNGILYHITHKNRVSKILKVGLAPKHLDKNVSHPGRIYLLTTNDINYQTLLGNDLYPTGEYVILKIDLNQMPYNTKLKFYIDPAYAKYGVFTCENIAPQCISVIE